MSEPRKAAAGIILHGDVDPRVLLVRRSDQLRFMAGHHAFPGGRIDDTEGVAHVLNAPDADEASAIHALAREIFEETGLLFARGEIPSRLVLRPLREALLAGTDNLDAILDRLGLKIDANDFIPAGLWITPKGGPIRFHTRYYLCRLLREPYEELIEGELSSLDWMTPAEARRKWREGAILLPAPVAYALQQLAEFPYPQSLEPLRRTTHVTPETPGRIEYRCGISVLPLRAPSIPPATHTNCVTIGEQEIYVIDPAPPDPDEQAALKKQIDHLLELGGRVAAVILSHSHPDHIGAAEFMRSEYGVPIWAHRRTADQVKISIDRALEDNETIVVRGAPDWRLRCLHTPGHDPGHLAFIEETTRTLLCGDMLANGSTIVVSRSYGGDMAEYLASLERLLNEEFDVMIPAHGLSFEKPKDKIREYIAHRLAREAKIEAAWAAGARKIHDLLAASYDDVAPAALPLAEHSLRAHLHKLGHTPAE